MNIMKKTNVDSFADIEFQLEWKSGHALHRDGYRASKVNLWRDCFPKQLYREIMDRPVGAEADLILRPGEVLPRFAPEKVFTVKAAQFDGHIRHDQEIAPRKGRFYPKGVLKGVAHVFPNNISPFRCARIQNGDIDVDFNHPLGGRDIRVRSVIRNVWEKFSDTGGSCNDWVETIAEGPGMQVRWREEPTDFFSDDPFSREDERPDTRFYRTPRLVNHIDDNAIGVISRIYGEILQPDSAVLDLMSSWTSHLPEHLHLRRLTGLGLNEAELAQNSALTDYNVHDLNENPKLPFEDGSYDAVICTASVEYLIRPFEVFREVDRVLKPGGTFAVSFSNRWFPPKAIRIWTEIHEFERMGLVLEYFLESGRFHDFATDSMRGLPRPEHDKYYHELAQSDPVYCVRGRKKEE